MTEETNQTSNGTTPEELKRLGFLYEYGTLATDTATKFYELAKKQAPSTLAPGKINMTRLPTEREREEEEELLFQVSSF